MVPCRSCGAPVLWVRTLKGKMMPLDAQPDPVRGYIEIVDGVAHVIKKDEMFPPAERYISHHATCPDADRWRKKDDVRAG